MSAAKSDSLQRLVRKPSDRQYAILRRRLMEETWGDQIKKCSKCGHPAKWDGDYIDGYVCQTCGHQEL